MKIHAVYDLGEVRRLAKRYPGAASEETERVLDLIVTRMESETVELTPAGVGGAAGLRGSIHGEVVEMGGRLTGVWGTPLEYGEVVEMGRRPGKAMPPVDPIELWVKRILGISEDRSRSVAFAVAMKIARKGFKGKKMFERAWKANERWAGNMLQSIGARVARRLNR